MQVSPGAERLRWDAAVLPAESAAAESAAAATAEDAAAADGGASPQVPADGRAAFQEQCAPWQQNIKYVSPCLLKITRGTIQICCLVSTYITVTASCKF